jgi:hypothetical protein
MCQPKRGGVQKGNRRENLSALSLVLPKCVSLKEGEGKEETDEEFQSSSVKMCQPKRGRVQKGNRREK